MKFVIPALSSVIPALSFVIPAEAGIQGVLAAFLLAISPLAQAAGNHHAVDDAAILDPGQCELEGWLERSRSGVKLTHQGIGCRVGPVELAAAGQYAKFAGVSDTGWELQLKWAREFAPGFSAGVSVTPVWRAHVRPRHQGTTLSGLFTWKATGSLTAHVNVGRDFIRGGGSLNRSGIALEWMPHAKWTLLAERYAQEGSQFVRGGLRWAFRDDLMVDFSRAHRLSGPGESSWTVGTTWSFER